MGALPRHLGTGIARDDEGSTPIATGDAFIFKPGEAHQLINDGVEDLVVYVVADNPIGESAHFPDSAKWVVNRPSGASFAPKRSTISTARSDHQSG